MYGTQLVGTVMTLPGLRRLVVSTLRLQVRWFCESAADAGSSRLTGLLKNRFPQATAVEVQDISGGCGAMYEVWVEAPDFKGLSRVKQHKLITETLKAEIQDMHGLRITTTLPDTT